MVTIVNWYMYVLTFFMDSHRAEYWWPILASSFVLLLIVILGLFAGFSKINPESLSDEELLTPNKFGIKAFFELAFAVVASTLESIIGKDNWEKYTPILGGTFLFILLNNLSGVVPGFPPATEQMNMTLAMALTIFVSFNFVGLKYGKLNYIKHLMGPVLWLAPLMFTIEFVGTCARPLSLSLRLFGNISGDHLVFSVFSGLLDQWNASWFPFPAGLLVFGTFVAALQAFIFMSLSAVYFKLSLDTAAHHH